MKLTRPLCLASESPRRAELLARFGFPFITSPADVDESYRPGEAPLEHAARLAQEKSARAQEKHPGHVVLAGDTVVVLEGRVMGKPRNPAHAREMLENLSGRTHEVVTAYHLADGLMGDVVSKAVVTRVTFRVLPAWWMAMYANLPEPLDKAGAYGIQGLGGAMVSRIEGSYNNVMGFPMEEILWDMLEKQWVIP
ncbi:MAG: Maf family protein [Deltaproteobacteria bacterium]|nr:Maf family protein [Deltaproteobacteria bacterium]MDH4121998.1 Maf family protein [Deltaproteobacteria bacterium]